MGQTLFFTDNPQYWWSMVINMALSAQIHWALKNTGGSIFSVLSARKTLSGRVNRRRSIAERIPIASVFCSPAGFSAAKSGLIQTSFRSDSLTSPAAMG
jgi:hypothetical protein